MGYGQNAELTGITKNDLECARSRPSRETNGGLDGDVPLPSVLLESFSSVSQQDAATLLHVHRQIGHLLAQLWDRLGFDGLLELFRQVFDCLFKVVRKEGFFRLYRDIVPYSLRIGPHS